MSVYLNVNEVFGATIQGEGSRQGRLATFLRLSGCNLSCSWCDTPYTWDWTRYERDAETHRLLVDDVAEMLARAPKEARIVVSGGEPLLQAKALNVLLTHPLVREREWDVETNGTRPLVPTAGLWSTVTASPKIIPSAGQDPSATVIHPQILQSADFKFVIADQVDLDAVISWVAAHEIPPHRVWLMPEGTDTDTLTDRSPFVMEAAAAHRFNFTSRLHVYGWGDTRGH